MLPPKVETYQLTADGVLNPISLRHGINPAGLSAPTELRSAEKDSSIITIRLGVFAPCLPCPLQVAESVRAAVSGLTTNELVSSAEVENLAVAHGWDPPESRPAPTVWMPV